MGNVIRHVKKPKHQKAPQQLDDSETCRQDEHANAEHYECFLTRLARHQIVQDDASSDIHKTYTEPKVLVPSETTLVEVTVPLDDGAGPSSINNNNNYIPGARTQPSPEISEINATLHSKKST